MDPRSVDGLRLLVGHQPLVSDPVDAFFDDDSGPDALVERPVPEESFLGSPRRGVWHATRAELLVATGNNGSAKFTVTPLYRVDPSTGQFANVDDIGLSPVLDVGVDDGGVDDVHNAREIASIDLDPDSAGLAGRPPPVCQPLTEVPTLQAPPVSETEPATLTAERSTVAVDPGQSQQAQLTLDLPADPSPLDVYFLLDTSGSFEPVAVDLAQGLAGIASGLGEAAVDAQFGLGGLGTAETYRYLRLADIAPPGPESETSLEQLCIAGSSESHLVALHQTATGSGLEDAGSFRPAIPAGQDPSWREDSLRTVVLITDTQFDDEGRDEQVRPREEIYAAFTERGVRVAGLEVVREVEPRARPSAGSADSQETTPGVVAAVEAADAAGTTASTPARTDMQELATATGALAPPGGIDCRGNRTVEIAEGDPLVCTTISSDVRDVASLSQVLERVLAAQTDLKQVSLQARSDATLEFVDPAGGVREGVDVKSTTPTWASPWRSAAPPRSRDRRFPSPSTRWSTGSRSPRPP